MTSVVTTPTCLSKGISHIVIYKNNKKSPWSKLSGKIGIVEGSQGLNHTLVKWDLM